MTRTRAGRAGKAGQRLSHVDSRGRVTMVDVGEKASTAREAIARGSIRMSATALAQIRRGAVKKGDPLQAARLAGIMAAKQTAALIPLCHPLPLSSIQVELLPKARGYDIEARVRTNAQTGVEMEALTAVAVAALTVYDMVKAVDKAMVIGDIRLEYKAGGKSVLVKILIAVYSPNAAWTLPRSFIESLQRDFPHHTFLDGWSDDDVARLLPEADAAFTASIRRGQIASLTRLKWIQSPAAGVGHLLSTELTEAPIVLTSARGVRARAIAEHVMTVTLALSRQIPAVVRNQAAHRWSLDELEPVIRTTQGRRMGIVGLGSIGMEVANLASAFGLRVVAIRRRVEAGSAASVESLLPPEKLHDLLSQSDVVVLSAPLTDQTRHLIDAAALAVMKRGAVLINVGRGKLVDDDALVDALRSGRIGGAALDVFTKEPLDPASPYWDLPNVIITPHISGAMEDYWTPLVALFRENLQRFEAGQPLLNVVDKRAGY